MKITTHTESELRDKLVRYIDYLDTKPHIECLPTLHRYRVKLVMNDYLTTKELNTVLRFLVRDVDKDIKELKTMFLPLVRTNRKKTVTKTTQDARDNTLDAFFI